MQLLLEALASMLKVDIRPTFDIPLSSIRLGFDLSIWTTRGNEMINEGKFRDTQRRTYVL